MNQLGETAVNKSLERFVAKHEVYIYRFTLVVMVAGNKCQLVSLVHLYKINTLQKHIVAALSIVMLQDIQSLHDRSISAIN